MTERRSIFRTCVIRRSYPNSSHRLSDRWELNTAGSTGFSLPVSLTHFCLWLPALLRINQARNQKKYFGGGTALGGAVFAQVGGTNLPLQIFFSSDFVHLIW